MNLACIDTGIFFCLAFKEPGFKYCKKILDDLYFKKIKGGHQFDSTFRALYTV